MLATAPQTTTQTETPNPASTAETRFNSLTHGASAKELFITGEDPAEFDKLLESSFRYYKPTSDSEAELITDLAQARWIFNRRRRIADQMDYHLHTTKPDPIDWTTADLNNSSRFDRYVTTAARAHQRALNNVCRMRRDNLRTNQWKQLHELKKQKFAMQAERLEMAKAREKRVAENHEIRKSFWSPKTKVICRHPALQNPPFLRPPKRSPPQPQAPLSSPTATRTARASKRTHRLIAPASPQLPNFPPSFFSQ